MPLSPELQERLDELLHAEPADEAELRRQVQVHVDAAESAALTSALVDIHLARTLGSACLALLDDWSDLPEHHRRLVQSACQYFAHTSDDDHDFFSVLGFEDDAELLNHVAGVIGRDEVVVEVD